MASARHASAAPRTQSRARSAPRTEAKRRKRGARAPVARIRWDRVGRIALLLMLGVVVGLYVQHTLSYLAVRAEANRQRAIVANLRRDNAQLTQEQRSLMNPATIVRDARALGMVRLGEHPYAMTRSPAP